MLITLTDTTRQKAIDASKGAGQWLTLDTDPEAADFQHVMACYGYLIRQDARWLANSKVLQRRYGLLAGPVMVGEIAQVAA